VDTYQSGRLDYPLSELEAGHHSLILKVWDTHNNLTEARTEFIVGEDNRLIIQNLLNYPNPFRDETRFSFEHNRSGENLSITIQIFSAKGKLVKTLKGTTTYSDFRINDITWDGRGESGKKLETGLYIYRVFIRSLLDGAKNTEYQKLIIIK
jgi:flagellar hook assembly protein FlgD